MGEGHGIDLALRFSDSGVPSHPNIFYSEVLAGSSIREEYDGLNSTGA